ncbi:unnamed protein product [Linum trigynum]|uniref:GH18 domain-containing protein n=1 Tax=Linum trigynum TaxID=586398 RepID=A0AAV2ER64_9ROSI
MNKYLDWASRITIYHRPWANLAGPKEALFDPKGKLSTEYYGIWSWLEAGVSTQKPAMGLPFYCRTWVLEDPSDHGIGSNEGCRLSRWVPGDGVLGYDDEQGKRCS